jgi:hypothetical protein
VNDQVSDQAQLTDPLVVSEGLEEMSPHCPRGPVPAQVEVLDEIRLCGVLSDHIQSTLREVAIDKSQLLQVIRSSHNHVDELRGYCLRYLAVDDPQLLQVVWDLTREQLWQCGQRLFTKLILLVNKGLEVLQHTACFENDGHLLVIDATVVKEKPVHQSRIEAFTSGRQSAQVTLRQSVRLKAESFASYFVDQRKDELDFSRAVLDVVLAGISPWCRAKHSPLHELTLFYFP